MRMLVLVQTPLQEPVEMMEYALLWVQVQLPVQAVQEQVQMQEESFDSELLLLHPRGKLQYQAFLDAKLLQSKL